MISFTFWCQNEVRWELPKNNFLGGNRTQVLSHNSRTWDWCTAQYQLFVSFSFYYNLNISKKKTHLKFPNVFFILTVSICPPFFFVKNFSQLSVSHFEGKIKIFTFSASTLAQTLKILFVHIKIMFFCVYLKPVKRVWHLHLQVSAQMSCDQILSQPRWKMWENFCKRKKKKLFYHSFIKTDYDDAAKLKH